MFTEMSTKCKTVPHVCVKTNQFFREKKLKLRVSLIPHFRREKQHGCRCTYQYEVQDVISDH